MVTGVQTCALPISIWATDGVTAPVRIDGPVARWSAVSARSLFYESSLLRSGGFYDDYLQEVDLAGRLLASTALPGCGVATLLAGRDGGVVVACAGADALRTIGPSGALSVKISSGPLDMVASSSAGIWALGTDGSLRLVDQLGIQASVVNLESDAIVAQALSAYGDRVAVPLRGGATTNTGTFGQLAIVDSRGTSSMLTLPSVAMSLALGPDWVLVGSSDGCVRQLDFRATVRASWCGLETPAQVILALP